MMSHEDGIADVSTIATVSLQSEDGGPNNVLKNAQIGSKLYRYVDPDKMNNNQEPDFLQF